MSIYAFGECELDPDRRELRRAGELVPLEPQVFELLSLLVRNPGRVVTKDEINQSIWCGRAVSDAALSSRISSARRAIGDDGKAQTFIRTAHGHGFEFVGAVTCQTADPAPQADERRRPVVAVIPFENLSGDPGEDYFSDGITADIIATLARHRWLSVVARNATAQFKGRAVGLEEVARVTGADYIVEGDVRRRNDRLRVSVQLCTAADGSCIWTERYDREVADLFDVQDEITHTIAARIEPEIGYVERQRTLSAAGSRDLRAWECYHLGVAHFFRFTAADNQHAQDYLQRARDLDPNFGDAHAWWAYAVILGTVYWDTAPDAALLDEALAATSEALRCDDKNAVFYALKARVQLARGEYASAIEGNRRAIELNPSFAAAVCGMADSLTYLGRYDEAIAQFEKAIALSTNDPQRWAFFSYGALACIFSGDYQRAVEWASAAEEIPNRQYWTLVHKAVALAFLDRDDEARRAFEAARAEQPALSLSFAREKLYYLKDAAQVELYVRGLGKAGAGE